MKYFDRAGRFRGAHKSRTWCFLGVFDGRGTHKSGTCPHAGGGATLLAFSPRSAHYAIEGSRIRHRQKDFLLTPHGILGVRLAGPPCARFACSGILQSAGLSNACARSSAPEASSAAATWASLCVSTPTVTTLFPSAILDSSRKGARGVLGRDGSYGVSDGLRRAPIKSSPKALRGFRCEAPPAPATSLS